MLPNKLQHGDSFARLFDLWNQLIDYLREIRLVAGPGIRINRLPAGTTIESTATATGSGGTSTVTEYVQKGPFDVEIVFTGTDENPAWKARVFNSSDEGASGTAGLLIIGPKQFSVNNAEFDIGSEMKYIFLEVNYDPEEEEYSYELKISFPVPQGTNRKYIKTIASVWIYHSTPYISMYVQRENIEVTGRWV